MIEIIVLLVFAAIVLIFVVAVFQKWLGPLNW